MQDTLNNTSENPDTEIADNVQVLTLPPAVTIENIEELADETRKLRLLPGEVLIIDVSHTEVITTPGVQLLLALAKTFADIGGTLIFKQQPKETFQQSFIALGLASRLTEWEKSRWLKKS